MMREQIAAWFVGALNYSEYQDVAWSKTKRVSWLYHSFLHSPSIHLFLCDSYDVHFLFAFLVLMVWMPVHRSWGYWPLSLTKEGFKEYKQWGSSFRWTITRWQPHLQGWGHMGELLNPWWVWWVMVWGMRHHTSSCSCCNLLASIYRA